MQKRAKLLGLALLLVGLALGMLGGAIPLPERLRHRGPQVTLAAAGVFALLAVSLGRASGRERRQ